MKTKIILFLAALSLVFGSAASAAEITVKPGDTMYLIAKRYNVSFAEVLRLNKHYADQNLIHPGDKILIPDKGTGTTTNNNSATDNIAQGNSSALAGGSYANAEAVLKLVNDERVKNGLIPLKLSEKLIDIANMKAADMANKKYFSHTSPTYGSPFEMLQQYGVTYRTAGENIAAGQKTANEVMTAWLNSSGHRANILNAKYTEIGVGYYKGGSYGTYWVQLFTGN